MTDAHMHTHADVVLDTLIEVDGEMVDGHLGYSYDFFGDDYEDFYFVDIFWDADSKTERFARPAPDQMAAYKAKYDTEMAREEAWRQHIDEME